MNHRHTEAMDSYFQEKDIAKRNEILNSLLLDLPADGKAFFLKAFKKERHLDMRLKAVRGYAAYASEEEVSPLMAKLLELLKKIPERTPYDYSEYESMRSVFLMPYLLERYGYACFHAFNRELETQYNAMPDCFKYIFTLDDRGNLCSLRDPDDVKASIQAFFGL